MYYKKVWLYILIIVVVSSLFPSVLIARAEDEPPETPPDRTYDFSNAPFPGKNGYLTESRWETFLQKAKEYQHQVIYVYTGFTLKKNKGSDTYSNRIVYFSAPMGGYNEYFTQELLNEPNDIWKFSYQIRLDENVQVNKIPIDGIDVDSKVIDFAFGSSKKIINKEYYMSIYYIADLEDDPYQEEPEMYNIDPQRGYGMYFIKPEYGEWINVPHAMGVWKDEIRLRVQIPRIIQDEFYGPLETYTIDGLWDKAVNLKIAIRITNVNADGYQKYADKVPGSADSWILPGKMKIINLVENGEAVQLEASLPMDYKKPKDGGNGLLVAELYVTEINEYGYQEFYDIKDARTWTKFIIYMGTVDADGDGFDDRTGLPVNKPKPDDTITDGKPNKEDYPDDIFGTIAYYFDTFIWYIKQPFVFIGDLIGNILDWISTTIDSWIDSFTSIFTRLFSFLPAEVILMLALGFATLMIITIIRAIRGS